MKLRKSGVGAEVHHAPVVTLEHEDAMWESGALGTDMPDRLLQTVFYTMGLHFSLRGGQEHRDLRVEQVTRVPADGYGVETHYQYVENGSKNYQGRFSEVGQKNKIVCAYAQLGSLRCPVRILDLYLSKLPSNASAFYMQPMPQLPKLPSKPWYKVTPVGVKPLKGIMAKISGLAGLTVTYTNHSLRATSASRMFAAGVSEKIVAEFTGNKSIKALRQYERTSAPQLRAAGLAITTAESFAASVATDSKPDATVAEQQQLGEEKVAIQKLLPSISGTHTNCTFNFNF